MKKILILLMLSAFTFAGSFSLSAGFSMKNMDYTEKNDGKKMDTEEGSAGGFYLKGDYNLEIAKNPLILGLGFGYTRGNLEYKGAYRVTSLIPAGSACAISNEFGCVKFKSTHKFYDLMLDAEFDTRISKEFFIPLYAGYGNRKWERGGIEDYEWGYYSVGAGVKYVGKAWGVSALYKANKATSPKLTMFKAHELSGKDAKFDLKDVKGYEIDIPITYTLSNKNQVVLEYNLIHWDIGGSNKITYTKGGVTGFIFEPSSKTDMNNIKLYSKINW